MEVVIPPRDHGPSTYKYMWDERGEVTQISRVDSGDSEEQPGIREGRHARKNSEAAGSGATGDGPGRVFRRGRQTVQWPFQSVVTETTETTSISSPDLVRWPVPMPPRRATWQNPGRRKRDSDEITIDRSIVPDYVVNYIRGETPETLREKRSTRLAASRSKSNTPAQAERRDIEVAHVPDGHRREQSHAAAFEGFSNRDDNSSRLRSLNSNDEMRRLTGGDRVRGRRRSSGGSGGLGGGPWREGGWRAGVALNVLLLFIILVCGFSCFVVAISRAESRLLSAQTILFSGSCAEASHISFGLHALVNIFGIVVIAGANYVFQVITSPTRKELDRAHARTRWLDLGIPSVRNFAYISNGRVFVALVLMVAAVVTQIIYNSIIFTTQSGLSSKLVLVSEGFLEGAQFSNATSSNAAGLTRFDILALQDLANREELVNLTSAQCLDRLNDGILATQFESVILVTTVESSGSSLIQTATGDAVSPLGGATVKESLGLVDSSLKYCLAKPQSGDGRSCQVALNGSLLGIAALLNLISVAFTGWVLVKSPFNPLVTLGDAVTSFLRDPDETTRDACLLTKTDVWQKRWGLREAKYWVPKNHYFFQSASLPRWFFVIAVWAVLVGLAGAALGMNIVRGSGLGVSATNLSGFGKPSPVAVFPLPASAPASAATFLAALPQLLLGVLYLSANSLLTTFFLSHESSLYALGTPRPLRVSADPVGEQTTSLYLTLPRPVSWFLAGVFAGLGFVLSQSIFVVATQPDGDSGEGSAAAPAVALGLSDTGLLALLALLVLLAMVTLGIGLRRAPAAVMVNGQALGNPLVLDAGSCSAVISARCHREPSERDAHRHALSWGVVSRSTGMIVSHCTYSARGVMQLDMSRSYA